MFQLSEFIRRRSICLLRSIRRGFQCLAGHILPCWSLSRLIDNIELVDNEFKLSNIVVDVAFKLLIDDIELVNKLLIDNIEFVDKLFTLLKIVVDIAFKLLIDNVEVVDNEFKLLNIVAVVALIL